MSDVNISCITGQKVYFFNNQVAIWTSNLTYYQEKIIVPCKVSKSGPYLEGKLVHQ